MISVIHDFGFRNLDFGFEVALSFTLYSMKKSSIIIVAILVAFFMRCSSGNPLNDDHDHENVDHDHETQLAVSGAHSEDEHSGDAHSHDEEEQEFHTSDTLGYTVLELERQPFSFTLRTSGRIQVDSRDVVIVTAKSSGLVRMNDDYLFPGVKVAQGDVLFTISGEQLTEGNSELNFMQVRADYDRATANYERAKKLIEDRIITQNEFLTAKNEYEKLRNVYDNLLATSGKDGNVVRSNGDGYIKEIFVTEGQKVSAGEQLASVVLEHNLVLKADVSPDKINVLPTINSANFTVGYSDKLYRINEMNGRKISQGKSTDANSYYIPLYFRMDFRPELIDGTFAEVYLLGDEITDAIVIPNTALMEEFGKIYVFVADEDGDFIKRYIERGYSDGERTQVISGLEEHEKIVATGTYRIKLSQMTTVAPAHNH